VNGDAQPRGSVDCLANLPASQIENIDGKPPIAVQSRCASSSSYLNSQSVSGAF
jgi:hypothetical protein